MIPSYYKAYNFNEDFMSMRIMPLMQAGDLAIVPRSEDVCNFLDFCIDLFDISYEQFVFYDSLDEAAFVSDVVVPLQNGCKKSSLQRLHVYAETSLTRLLQKELELSECNVDSEAYGLRYSDKSFLYELKGIVNVPRFEQCSTVFDLHNAYNSLSEVSKLLLKPIIGTGGKGFFVVEDEAQLHNYDFEFGPVVLQECMHPDLDANGFVLSPSIQFNGKEILGLVAQYIKNYSFKGVRCPGRLSESINDSLLRVSQKLLNKINPQGMGGFDFIIVNDEPVLIDINLGRITGVHPFWSFCFKHNLPQIFHGFPVHASCSLEGLFEVLKKEEIIFSIDSKSGVVPFGWIPDEFGFVAIFGPHLQEVQAIADRLHIYFDCL
jgi:hypothetical protein